MMNSYASAAFIYRLAGHPDRVIRQKLIRQHQANAADADKAVAALSDIPHDAIAIPRLLVLWTPYKRSYLMKIGNGKLIRCDLAQLRMRAHTALELGHEIIEFPSLVKDAPKKMSFWKITD